MRLQEHSVIEYHCVVEIAVIASLMQRPPCEAANPSGFSNAVIDSPAFAKPLCDPSSLLCPSKSAMASTAALVAESATTASLVIERMRYTMNNVLSFSRKVDDRQNSPETEAVGGKWSIVVYLGGNQGEYAGYFSVHLTWKGKREDKPKDV